MGWVWKQQMNVPHPHPFTREQQLARPIAALKKSISLTTFNKTSAAENAEIERKLSILDEILVSKNDNDPRLDTQFKHLTPAEKQALHLKYESIKRENRNERGTVVFLLSRKLESSQDFDFLRTVVSEDHCNSLLNCNAPLSSSSTPEAGSGEIGVTLEYPQIIALKALEAHLSQFPNTPGITEILNEAGKSKNQIASKLAQSLLQKYP
jgi:hypothetical protein